MARRVGSAAVNRTLIIKGIVLGLGAGVMSGLFGIGGGAVMVPVLVLWMAFPQHRAHATSLAAIILTAASGMARFADGGAVHVGAGVGIAIGAIVGAFLGAGLMHRLSPARLRQVFAILQIGVSIQMLLGFTPEGGAFSLSPVEAVVAYILLGLVTGVLSSTMGVGGGVIMVPAMVLLFGFTQHAAEGTSLLIMIPTAVVGSVRHARKGYTDWRMGLILGLGGIIGAWLGASVALGLESELLQRLFALFLLLSGLHLLWTTLRPERPEPDESEV